MLLQGLYVPLPCPFYRDGVSYLRKLEHNVARYSLGPASGLLALPPGGEANTLSDAETFSSLESVAAFAHKSKVLLAGVERAGVSAALSLIEAAERHAFDAVLLAPPTDWARLVRGGAARELLLFYLTIADRSPLPLVLWSEAKPPSLELPVEVIAELAQHPRVIGLVDGALSETRLQAVLQSTGSVQHDVTVTTVFEAVTRRMLKPEASAPMAGQPLVSVEALSAAGGAVAVAELALPTTPVLKTRSKQVGFQVLSAATASDVVPLLNGGAAGLMPQLAACAPQSCFEAYAAWKDGDQALALERAGRLAPSESLLAKLGPAAVKTGCDFNGYYGGPPRLPRLPLTAGDRASVEDALGMIRS